MKRLLMIILLTSILLACGLPIIAETLPTTAAPQGTPVAPTPTPIPLPSGYRIQDMYGYVVLPIVVPPDTTDQEDDQLMNEINTQLGQGVRSYGLFKCIDRTTYLECYGVIKPK